MRSHCFEERLLSKHTAVDAGKASDAAWLQPTGCWNGDLWIPKVHQHHRRWREFTKGQCRELNNRRNNWERPKKFQSIGWVEKKAPKNLSMQMSTPNNPPPLLPRIPATKIHLLEWDSPAPNSFKGSNRNVINKLPPTQFRLGLHEKKRFLFADTGVENREGRSQTVESQMCWLHTTPNWYLIILYCFRVLCREK